MLAHWRSVRCLCLNRSLRYGRFWWRFGDGDDFVAFVVLSLLYQTFRLRKEPLEELVQPPEELLLVFLRQIRPVNFIYV